MDCSDPKAIQQLSCHGAGQEKRKTVHIQEKDCTYMSIFTHPLGRRLLELSLNDFSSVLTSTV